MQKQQKQYFRDPRTGVWMNAPARRVRIVNRTTIPNDVINSVIRLVRPPGISGFTVEVSQTRRCHLYGHGCSRSIKCYLNEGARYPRKQHVYQYGQLKARFSEVDPVTGRLYQLKGRRYYLSSFVEAMIYIFAHELMHVRQGQKGGLRGRVWGARGRYSEVETEAYAIRKLREWRKAQ